MTTFNKILNPMYSVIAAYSRQEDGSINAKYVLGTGTAIDPRGHWQNNGGNRSRPHLCLLKRARTDCYLII